MPREWLTLTNHPLSSRLGRPSFRPLSRVFLWACCKIWTHRQKGWLALTRKKGGKWFGGFSKLVVVFTVLLCTDFSLVYAWGSLANHNVMILKEIFLCWYDWFDIMFFWDHGKNVVWVSCDLQCTRTVHVILDVVYNHRKYIYISFMHFFLLFFTKQNIYILSKNINLYFEQKKKTLL